MMAHMPLEGQALDMAEEGIPHGFHEGFAGLGVEHAETVARHGADEGHRHNAERRKPELLPEDFRAAEGLEHGLDRAGQIPDGRTADHVIHGDADDLGNDHIRERGQGRTAHTKEE